MRPWRRQLLVHFLRVSFALAAAAILIQFQFDYIESYLFDQRIKWTPSHKISHQIALIMVDSKTVEHYKKIPDTNLHVQLLKQLLKSPPLATIYISSFNTLEGNTESKKQFAQLAQQLPHFMGQTEEMSLKGESGKLTFEPPFQALAKASGPKTADRNIMARDGVSRRVIVSYQDQLLLHAQVAALVKPELLKSEKNIQGLLDLFDSKQTYIRFQKAGRFDTYRFEDLISGQIPMDVLQNKIVLIGDDLGLNMKDYATTPLERNSFVMTNTELHANAIETLIENSAPRQALPALNWLLTSLVSILTIYVVLTLRPLRGIQILVSTALLVVVVSFLAFWFFDLWIILTQPLLAVFLCYYFFIPYRLIIENRRSWEYYEKNKILRQVEELKTNFISMMSHDLKTPIARIQGMTDVILKEQNPLSHPQREAVDSIRFSAQDLLTIINSILNYARIESQGVQLHRQARDINQLLEEVIKRHDFMARVKHIKIKSELEPLFSTLVDPDVLKQVFSNLLENAIKYSPEHSTVTIKSLEVGGEIVVQFADQGPGIAEDELAHVFMKFFRSRHAKASPVKGSGLGLYLAKYFVELHDGRIEVASSPGKGSTFTVKLPLSNA